MELLVVMAIIAILAALTFPAVMRSLEEGRQARCASNLRQIGVALQMYLDDYDGRFFWGRPSYGGEDLAVGMDWYRWGGREEGNAWENGNGHRRPLNAYLFGSGKGPEDFFRCPSDRGSPETVSTSARTVYDLAGASYMFNAIGRGGDGDDPLDPAYHGGLAGRRINEFEAVASRKLVFYDSSLWYFFWENEPGHELLLWHTRRVPPRANALFLDGACRFVQVERLMGDDWQGRDYAF